MTYKGTVRNGVVVFESDAPPEGAQVRVDILEQGSGEGGSYQRLKKHAGTIEGPTDWAANHDHYIHGKPKQ